MNVGLALLLVVVLWLVAMAIQQLRMQRAAQRQVGRPAPALSDLPTSGAVLVWFHSPSCGPCRAMEPAVEALAAEGHQVVAIDVFERRADAHAWSIAATPTSVFVRDGTITASRVGALPKATLHALISA